MSARLLQRLPIGPPSSERLYQKVWGVPFPNPVGLAAGFDKNCEAPRAWPMLGFGFAELGTVTYQPQKSSWNVKRISENRAYINKLGFPNPGALCVVQSLNEQLPPVDKPLRTPIGISIGKSRQHPLALAYQDYMKTLELLEPYADYVVLNISSPNTIGLRTLQDVSRLKSFLERCTTARKKPLLVKVGPDMTHDKIWDIAQVCKDTGVKGIVATNTYPLSNGGLSGMPIKSEAEDTVRILFQATQGRLPIIGVGGIFTAKDAYERICAGASLVQVYTALLYGYNPWKIVRGLDRILQNRNILHVQDAVGSQA